jgi:hypothetical protein
MSNREEEEPEVRVTIEIAVLPEAEEGIAGAGPVVDEAAASELVNLLSSTAQNLSLGDPLSDRLDPLIGLRQGLAAQEEDITNLGIDPNALTSVGPILSSIRDLRSALHDRVINLGMEVEGLRSRASVVERGFAESRRRRGEERTNAQLLDSLNETRPSPAELEDGLPPTPFLDFITESLTTGTDMEGLAAGPIRDATYEQESTYEIVKGSGSAEIEGSREERRERRLQQLKLANVSC